MTDYRLIEHLLSVVHRRYITFQCWYRLVRVAGR